MPSILEDMRIKSNHHLLKRIIQDDLECTIRELDTNKSSPEEYRYWVKQYYGAILISEKHLVAFN
jgi:hypothetical protein